MYKLSFKNEISGYTWKKEWIQPYESLWSIIEKFKYVNCLDRLDSKHFSVKYKGYDWELQEDNYNFIYTKKILYDTEEFPRIFGIDKEHYKILEKFQENKLELFLDKKLKICPECIGKGYHSYIHQLSWNERCFIHNCSLKSTELQYCIIHEVHEPYFNNELIKQYIPSSKDLIIKMLSNNFNVPLIYDILNKHILNIRVIDLNTPVTYNIGEKKLQQIQKFIETSLQDNVYENFDKYKMIFHIGKKEAEEQWRKLNYHQQFFSDLCYEYSQKLYNSIDKEVLEQTRREFNASYIATKIYNKTLEYNYEAISIIMTAGILTGYYGFDIDEIFTSNWLKRKHFCIFEKEFIKYLEQCKSVYSKIAFIELYKFIISKIHKQICVSASNGNYSQCNTLTADYEIKIPIFLFREKHDYMEIFELNF